jgi:hypothetical protein
LVRWFRISSDEQKSYSPADTVYSPPCSRSSLDVPLSNGGGSLTIGYGSGGSPLLIPFSDSEGLAFLKISLFSHPLNPLYDAHSFRSAHRLPDNFKGPWATITKRVIHCPSKMRSVLPNAQSPDKFIADKAERRTIGSHEINAHLSIGCLINHKLCALRSPVSNDRHEKNASPLDLSKWSVSWTKSLRQRLPRGQGFLVRVYALTLPSGFAHLCQNKRQLCQYSQE